MGYIKEPKGVDFTVINREMTQDEKKKLSDFIAKRKMEISKIRKKRRSPQLAM
jgi:hypothetical protein